MLSLVSFLFFQTLAYIFIWFYVRAQPWFVEYQFVQDLFPPNASYEQTNVFLYASAASVIGAIVFSKGAPYRKPLYSNGKHFLLCQELKESQCLSDESLSIVLNLC